MSEQRLAFVARKNPGSGLGGRYSMARWRYGSSQGLRDRKSCRRVDRHEGVLAWKAAPRNSCVCGAYARGGALEYWAKQIIERADAGMGEIYFLNPLRQLEGEGSELAELWSKS